MLKTARKGSRRRSRRSRRASVETRSKPKNRTGWLKLGIMFLPAAARAVADAENAGGITTKNGIVKGLVPSLTTSYTGVNTNDGKFYPQDLLWGYAPIFLETALSKAGVFSRIGKAMGK